MVSMRLPPPQIPGKILRQALALVKCQAAEACLAILSNRLVWLEQLMTERVIEERVVNPGGTGTWRLGGFPQGILPEAAHAMQIT